MGRNFLKINTDEYSMVSDPDESDQVMADRGYTKVSDSQFDEAFILYIKVLNGETNNIEVSEYFNGNL